MKKIEIKDLVILALLLGLNVVLSRFLSINAWNIKIGFTFVTVYVAAYFYGPIGGALVGGLGDLIGALLFPIGAYFPGFTLTATLTGIVFGLVVGKKDDIKSFVVATLINELLLSLLLNTYWIHVLYKADFKALLLTRSIQCVVMMVVEVIVLKILSKVMPQFERRFRQK